MMNMEKRRFTRYFTFLQSVIISEGKSYASSVENVSEEGLACKMSTFAQALIGLFPDKLIKLIISTPTGDTINLNCKIKWGVVPCNDEKLCMGMKIIDPPEKYKEYVKTLN
jgi:hypothetical protein